MGELVPGLLFVSHTGELVAGSLKKSFTYRRLLLTMIIIIICARQPYWLPWLSKYHCIRFHNIFSQVL